MGEKGGDVHGGKYGACGGRLPFGTHVVYHRISVRRGRWCSELPEPSHLPCRRPPPWWQTSVPRGIDRYRIYSKITVWFNQVVKSGPMADQNREQTRWRILEAARRRLVEEGYARLSTRQIAAEAGVNHALIHYYFGTKDQLVVAVLDEANRRLLSRQSAMYETPGGFAEKWARACAFYEEDLASGFVRLQLELWSASLANPELRAVFLPRLLAWRRVVRAAVREAVAHYALDLPVSAEMVSDWICTYWGGMEFEMLIGIGEEDGHYQAALDAMQHLLERLDRQAADGRASTDAAVGADGASRGRDIAS